MILGLILSLFLYQASKLCLISHIFSVRDHHFEQPIKEESDSQDKYLFNQNDFFRQKQEQMKREMQQDFQQHMKANQNVDARKQRIQRQRQQPSQDSGSSPFNFGDKRGKLQKGDVL